MKDMHYFDKDATVEFSKSKQAKSALKMLYSDEQTEHIQEAISEVGDGVYKYFRPTMSCAKIDMVKECFSLGEEYAQQFTSYDLSDQQAEAALYSYKHDFNMITQLVSGEDPENVKLITDAVNTPGFVLMDYFDETGAFLNYDKIRKFLSE